MNRIDYEIRENVRKALIECREEKGISISDFYDSGIMRLSDMFVI